MSGRPELWRRLGIDGFLVFQLAAVAVGALASLLAMMILGDAEIISSQAIVSTAQVAATPLGVILAAASLEHRNVVAWRNAAVAGVAGVGIWFTLWGMSAATREHWVLAALFLAALFAGELSSLARARIINSPGSRLPLVWVNLGASSTRLGSFLVLLAPLGGLIAFVASAAVSNLARGFGVVLVARGREPKGPEVGSSESGLLKRPTAGLRRLGAYFDRNPSVLIVLVLANLTPLWGGDPVDFALAILLMNLSMAVAGMMWARFERLERRVTPGALRPLAVGWVLLVTAALAWVFLVPEGIVAAESLARLRQSSVILVVWPTIFGFTCGLNVLTYGSLESVFKLPLIAAAFYVLGRWGFVAGTMINVGFAASRTSMLHHAVIGGRSR